MRKNSTGIGEDALGIKRLRTAQQSIRAFRFLRRLLFALRSLRGKFGDLTYGTLHLRTSKI